MPRSPSCPSSTSPSTLYATSMDSISLFSLLSVPRHPLPQTLDPEDPVNRDLLSLSCIQLTRSSPRMHMHISDILQDALLLCEDIDGISDGQEEGDNVHSRNSRANRLARLGSQGRSLHNPHDDVHQEQNGPTGQ
jgi:hypothetical protein